MNLKTERLILRELSWLDLEDIHQLHSLPEVDEFNTLGIPKDIEESQKLLTDWMNSENELPRKRYIFSIENDKLQFIGLIGIQIGKPNYKNAEIWYKLLPKHWNQGFAKEAVNKILHFCFTELNLHRIEAGCATQNMASIKVLEKSGFQREGLRRKILPIRGEWLDNYEYALLDEDFQFVPEIN